MHWLAKARSGLTIKSNDKCVSFIRFSLEVRPRIFFSCYTFLQCTFILHCSSAIFLSTLKFCLVRRWDRTIFSLRARIWNTFLPDWPTLNTDERTLFLLLLLEFDSLFNCLLLQQTTSEGKKEEPFYHHLPCCYINYLRALLFSLIVYSII